MMLLLLAVAVNVCLEFTAIASKSNIIEVPQHWYQDDCQHLAKITAVTAHNLQSTDWPFILVSRTFISLGTGQGISFAPFLAFTASPMITNVVALTLEMLIGRRRNRQQPNHPTNITMSHHLIKLNIPPQRPVPGGFCQVHSHPWQLRQKPQSESPPAQILDKLSLTKKSSTVANSWRIFSSAKPSMAA